MVTMVPRPRRRRKIPTPAFLATSLKVTAAAALFLSPASSLPGGVGVDASPPSPLSPATPRQGQRHRTENQGRLFDDATAAAADSPAAAHSRERELSDESLRREQSSEYKAALHRYSVGDRRALQNVQQKVAAIISSRFPNCTAFPRYWIGDGVCDSGVDSAGTPIYNTEECGWDFGDCCAESCNDEIMCGVPKRGNCPTGQMDCRNPRPKPMDCTDPNAGATSSQVPSSSPSFSPSSGASSTPSMVMSENPSATTRSTGPSVDPSTSPSTQPSVAISFPPTGTVTTRDDCGGGCPIAGQLCCIEHAGANAAQCKCVGAMSMLCLMSTTAENCITGAGGGFNNQPLFREFPDPPTDQPTIPPTTSPTPSPTPLPTPAPTPLPTPSPTPLPTPLPTPPPTEPPQELEVNPISALPEEGGGLCEDVDPELEEDAERESIEFSFAMLLDRAWDDYRIATILSAVKEGVANELLSNCLGVEGFDDFDSRRGRLLVGTSPGTAAGVGGVVIAAAGGNPKDEGGGGDALEGVNGIERRLQDRSEIIGIDSFATEISRTGTCNILEAGQRCVVIDSIIELVFLGDSNDAIEHFVEKVLDPVLLSTAVVDDYEVDGITTIGVRGTMLIRARAVDGSYSSSSERGSSDDGRRFSYFQTVLLAVAVLIGSAGLIASLVVRAVLRRRREQKTKEGENENDSARHLDTDRVLQKDAVRSETWDAMVPPSAATFETIQEDDSVTDTSTVLSSPATSPATTPTRETRDSISTSAWETRPAPHQARTPPRPFMQPEVEDDGGVEVIWGTSDNFSLADMSYSSSAADEDGIAHRRGSASGSSVASRNTQLSATSRNSNTQLSATSRNSNTHLSATSRNSNTQLSATSRNTRSSTSRGSGSQSSGPRTPPSSLPFVQSQRHVDDDFVSFTFKSEADNTVVL